MANIILRDICKQYADGATVLKNFNLEVNDGEFVVILGQPGSGKSGVLRIVAGLEEADSGELLIGDRQINGLDPQKREIAMIFQNGALYPHMTAFENMAFGLSIMGLSKEEIRRRVEDAAALLDIAHLLDRRPKALSGGQRQRVTLGRAVVRKPKAYLLDEPLSNLDEKLRAQMRTELSKLHMRLKATFLYATPDQVEAVSIGDRIVVMKEGAIQQAGSPTQLYTAPKNLYVATSIGNPAINVLKVSFRQGVDGVFAAFGTKGKSCLLPMSRRLWEAAGSRREEGGLLGIRPESFRDKPDPSRREEFAPVEGELQSRKSLGGRNYLELDCAGEHLVAAASENSARPGQPIRLWLDMNQVLLFDAETTQILSEIPTGS